jgi:hypothetical protein
MKKMTYQALKVPIFGVNVKTVKKDMILEEVQQQENVV